MVDDYGCELMKKGIINLSLDKFGEALLCFEEVLSFDNHNFAALNNKGLALNGEGKFFDAIKCFDKILHEDDEFIFSLIGKGESLYYLEYYDLSIEYFNRALKLDSKNDGAIFFKALCYNKLEQYEKSKECLNLVKKLSKNLFFDSQLYNRISNNLKKEFFDVRSQFIDKLEVYKKSEDYEKYSVLADNALEFDPKFAFFLLNKAYSLFYLKKYHESLKYIENILKLDFLNINALNLKSKILIELNQFDNALNCLNQISHVGGSVDDSLYENVLFHVKEYKETINSLIQKGNHQADLGNYVMALNYYDETLSLNQTNKIALNNKGFVLYLLNKYHDSIIVFDQVLKLKPHNAGSLLGKSYSLCCLGNYGEALDCYNSAVSINQSLQDDIYFKMLIDKISEK